MAKVTLTISSRNYSSWSLRGWLLCKMAGLSFETVMLPIDDASSRAELLLLSPSFLVPCLSYEGIEIWDTLAIAEFLQEILPDSGLMPKDRGKRAWCRSVSGEIWDGEGLVLADTSAWIVARRVPGARELFLAAVERAEVAWCWPVRYELCSQSYLIGLVRR